MENKQHLFWVRFVTSKGIYAGYGVGEDAEDALEAICHFGAQNRFPFQSLRFEGLPPLREVIVSDCDGNELCAWGRFDVPLRHAVCNLLGDIRSRWESWRLAWALRPIKGGRR
jgi:hypothetical protein